MSVTTTQDQLAVQLALQDVMLNYAAGVDERDRERYSACFTDDVLIVGFSTGNYEGRDKWVEYVWSALENYRATQHMLGPVLVSCDTATVEKGMASARTDVQATHFLTDDGGRFTLWATYLTDFRKVGGRWLICRNELKVCGTHNDS